MSHIFYKYIRYIFVVRWLIKKILTGNGYFYKKNEISQPWLSNREHLKYSINKVIVEFVKITCLSVLPTVSKKQPWLFAHGG